MKGDIILTFLLRRFNPVWLMACCLVLSRLMFLNAGYGVEPDAWRVARAAGDIAATGHYAVSRFPGYPAHEFACAALARFGPAGLNGASLAMTIIGFFFFLQSLLRIRAGWPIWTAAALTFVPVVFVASMTAKDYAWGLAFILIAHDMILARRPQLAGIALGLAIGTRLTNGMMILPLAILLDDPRSSVRGRLEFVVTSLLVGAACFAPVAGVYGTSFLQFSTGGGYPPLPLVAYRFGHGVWGILGMAGLALAAGMTLSRRRDRREFSRRFRVTHPIDRAAWGLAAGLPVLMFIILPHQPGYLIPALPFVLLMGARWLPARGLFTLLLCTALSPFLFGIVPGFEPAAVRPIWTKSVRLGGKEFWASPFGAAYWDNLRREQLMEAGELAIRLARISPDSNAVIVAGWWQPQLEMQMLAENGKIDPRFVYALDAREADEAAKAGRPIYTLPGQVGFNQQLRGVDLKARGAKPLIEGME